MSDYPKTLIIHHRSGIGDLLWHIPYIREIARNSEAGRVGIVAKPSTLAKDLLMAEECISDIYYFDYKQQREGDEPPVHNNIKGQLAFFKAIRNEGYTRVYIFSNRVRYGFLCALAGFKERYGFGFSWVERLFLTSGPYIQPYRGAGNWVYPEATQFTQAHGYVDSAVVPKMQIDDAIMSSLASDFSFLDKCFVCFSIGTSEPRKHWGNHRYAQLACLLIQKGYPVVCLGGPKEQEKYDDIYKRLDEEEQPYLFSGISRSIQKTAALLSKSALCLGNDTGALNISTAVNTVAIGLFGETPPLTHDDLMLSIYQEGMDKITEEAVLKLAMSVLDSSK